MLWDLEDTSRSRLIGMHKDWVRCVKMEKEIVVSCSKDGAVRLWNLENAEKNKLIGKHKGDARSVSIQGNIVVSGGYD